jgi:hypothetical protein
MKDFFGKIVGEDGVKFSISLDMESLTYLGISALVVGTILILISKKLIK